MEVSLISEHPRSNPASLCSHFAVFRRLQALCRATVVDTMQARSTIIENPRQPVAIGHCFGRGQRCHAASEEAPLFQKRSHMKTPQIKDNGDSPWSMSCKVHSSLFGSSFRRLSTPFHMRHALRLHDGINFCDSCQIPTWLRSKTREKCRGYEYAGMHVGLLAPKGLGEGGG